jgi:hypothetical protein
VVRLTFQLVRCGYTLSRNFKNIIFAWVHNIKTHTKNIMIIEHIGIEGTRLT